MRVKKSIIMLLTLTVITILQGSRTLSLPLDNEGNICFPMGTKDVININNILTVEMQGREIIKKPVEYNPYDLTIESNLTTYELSKILQGTNMLEVASFIIESEKEYGVNALFITSLIALESGWNTSYRASTQNNLTGHAVYSSSSRGSNFSSKYDNIMTTVKMIKEEYLSSSGSCYNGLSIWSVNEKYCLKSDKRTIDYDWSKKINMIANELLAKCEE